MTKIYSVFEFGTPGQNPVEDPTIPILPPIPSGRFMPPESKIPKGGWRSWFPPFRDVYRTLDGRHFFEFEFHAMEDGNVEIDIIRMPDYPTLLVSNLHETHRLESNHGNEFRVCFGDASESSSIDSAQEWAGAWAEHSMRLIESGIEFPNV